MDPAVPPAARSGAIVWLIAAGSMVPLAILFLGLGLGLASMALVYVSILCSVAWMPLLIVGMVKLARSGQSIRLRPRP